MKRKNLFDCFVLLMILLFPLALHYSLLTKGVLSTIDTPQAYFPLRWLVYKSLSGGNFPWWNQYLAGGMSLIAYPDAAAFYFPSYFLFFFLKPVSAFNISFMLHYGLAGVFMYLLLRRLKIMRPAAIIGSLAFMFCGFFVGHRVHAVVVETAVWLPGIVWTVWSWLDTRRSRWAILTSVFVTMQIFSGYMQIVLMTWFICGAIIFYWTIFNFKKWYVTLGIISSMIAGVLFAGFHLMNVAELAGLSLRSHLSFEQFTEGSFSLKSLWLLLFPFLQGAQWYSGAYIGVPYYRGTANFAETAAYGGAFLITAVAASFWNINHYKKILLFLLITAVALIWMLGSYTPVAQFMYVVPFFNKFRVPSRYLLIFLFCLTILGSIGIDAIINSKKRISLRIGALISYGLIIVSIILLVHLGKIPGASYQRQWVKLPLILTGGIWLFCALSFIPRIGKFIVYGIIFLAVWDISMFAYNRNLSNVTNNFKEKNTLLSSKEYHDLTKNNVVKPRVFNCFHNYQGRNKGIGANINVLMEIPTLDCYGPLFLKEFGWLGHNPSAFYHNPDNLIYDNDALAMLNVKYLASFNNKSVLAQTVKKRKIESFSTVLLPPFEKWEKSGDVENNSFRSQNGKIPAMVFVPVELKKNTAYRFHVNASSKNADGALRIDLSAQNYDNSAQEFEIKSYMMEKKAQVFEHVIETGNDIPKKVLIRIFTFSKKPVVVNEFSLEKLSGQIIEEKIGVHYKIASSSLTENISICGYAWFPEKLTPTPGKWAALDWINNSPVVFNPRKEALVESLPDSKKNPQTAEIEFLTNSPNSRLFVVNNRGVEPVFMAISEVKYPGWRAFVDGKQKNYYRVNGLISGLFVPPGKHSITIKFRPTAIKKGMFSFSLGIILLITLLFINFRIERKLITQ